MKPFLQFTLMIVGFGVIVTGLVLMFDHQAKEFAFQNSLLSYMKTEYHWRSIGVAYGGIAAIAVGAAMMAVAAIVARIG